MTGLSSARRRAGMFATRSPCHQMRSILLSVTSPITVQSRSQRSQTSRTSAICSAVTIASMRSWLSLIMISQGSMSASRSGTRSAWMSSKGHVGLDIHADRVPLREADMEPWEIMISASQERMLAIVTAEQIADVREVCKRWDLDCTVIGEVTDSKMLRIWWHGERVANIPARRLADESPVIRTPSVKPGYIVDEPVAVDDAAYPRPKDLGAALTQLLAAPNIASKRWAWEQYDYIVQANTCLLYTSPSPRDGLLSIRRQRQMWYKRQAEGPGRGAHAAPRRAQHREQALGLGAVRLHRAGQHHADPRLRRRRAAHQGLAARHRLQQRLQRPPLLPRSVSRRQGGGRRGGPQPGLRRRPAGGGHRLPQLRQPREGRDLLAVRAGRRGHRPGLRGARHAGRQRQRELLQRELRPGHLPHADDRHAGRVRGRQCPRRRRLQGRRRRDRDARRRGRLDGRQRGSESRLRQGRGARARRRRGR